MVVSGSVLGPEPAGWPVKDLRVNKIAQDRFKAKADVDAYVMTQKPTKIVYDVWNPFDTRGVGNMGGNESLYSLDRIERLETLRQLGLPIPDTVAPGEEDIYITSVLSDYGVGSLEQWLNMTAEQREKTIDAANKRGRESRPTARGEQLTTPPMDDNPFFEIQQGFQNLSGVLQDHIRTFQSSGAGSYTQNAQKTFISSGTPQRARVSLTPGQELNEAQQAVSIARKSGNQDLIDSARSAAKYALERYNDNLRRTTSGKQAKRVRKSTRTTAGKSAAKLTY